MEYATRDQAQQAVNTLSNQNLMGRLVYVREVSILYLHRLSRDAGEVEHISDKLSRHRTAKPNLDLLDHQQHVGGTKGLQAAAAIVAAAADSEDLLPPAADAKYSSTTSVIPRLPNLRSERFC